MTRTRDPARSPAPATTRPPARTASGSVHPGPPLAASSGDATPAGTGDGDGDVGSAVATKNSPSPTKRWSAHPDGKLFVGSDLVTTVTESQALDPDCEGRSATRVLEPPPSKRIAESTPASSMSCCASATVTPDRR